MNRTEFIDMWFNDLEIYDREHLGQYSISGDKLLEILRACWKESKQETLKEIKEHLENLEE